MTHRLAADSSWWPVLRILAEKNSVSIVLIGSAVYMTAEHWFGPATKGMPTSAVEAGYTVPVACNRMAMDDFGHLLREADKVISI